MRTVVLLLAAFGTLVEAVAFGGGLYLLGTVIDTYSMSMGGLPPDRGRLGVWLLGALLALALAALAVLLAVAAVRGRALGAPTRVLVVAALALHGMLGLVVVLAGDASWFLGVVVVFACLLLSLTVPPPMRRPAPGAVTRHGAS